MIGEAEIEQFSSDYKKVGGMMIAHSMATYANGQEYMKITISKVSFNTGLDDSLFKMQ
jgi:outer membrane lipoprotein-sorting protein